VIVSVPPCGWVSIHAPAWGATGGLRLGVGCALVSIHAPAWGATPKPVREIVEPIVSIHAPAWGATQELQLHALKGKSFNPRARVGRDKLNRKR